MTVVSVHLLRQIFIHWNAKSWQKCEVSLQLHILWSHHSSHGEYWLWEGITLGSPDPTFWWLQLGLFGTADLGYYDRFDVPGSQSQCRLLFQNSLWKTHLGLLSYFPLHLGVCFSQSEKFCSLDLLSMSIAWEAISFPLSSTLTMPTIRAVIFIRRWTWCGATTWHQLNNGYIRWALLVKPLQKMSWDRAIVEQRCQYILQ